MNLDHYKQYAPILLRIGLSIVFLWFGIHQIINPESFLGYVPALFDTHPNTMMHEHPLQSLHTLPITPHILIMGNGFFETILGILLITGIFIRVVALLLSLHLVGIMVSLGYNDIAVRDFGLFLATLSVALHGPDQWCLGNKIFKKKII